MKRILTALCAALLLTACSTQESQKPTEQSTGDPFSSAAQTQPADSYDPFALPEDAAQGRTMPSFSHGVVGQDGANLVFAYAPTVTFPYELRNDSAKNDFGLLLFVNGFRQPYRTDDDPAEDILHVFDVDAGETALRQITFAPVAGEPGETLSVQIVLMIDPRFTPTAQTKDGEWFITHSLHPLCPAVMTVTDPTGATAPAVCTEYDTEEITDALRHKYDRMSATGGYSGENDLDRMLFAELLKNDVLVTPADRAAGNADQTPFTASDSITVCLYGGGAPCTYRVSLYCDHGLVSGAFDGADYVDMTPSRDVICKRVIDPSLLPGGSYVYFIAVPLQGGKTMYPEKSRTVFLSEK